ncbi:hypothetical protein D9619_005465 [Psilocybe cf. subviscida]|uniref:2',3'-cyclic-nucleotide 3'-phosphodiesterase n=1 Tax=Psilocybe cf. subviscida TaxID=2480587 RepID=A0A8H5FB57_9AGAR|nr:hypothetical protein D9619_005465 [Psilocybe cf. subviscida]
MGLSLWIVPDVATADKLQHVMKIRPPGYDAAQKGSSERKNISYPTFYPHITLASLPEAMEHDLDTVEAALPLERVASEASGLAPPIDVNLNPSEPIVCTFAAVETGNVYYRSVYVAIALSESQSPGLAALHAQVHAKLDVPIKTPAFPHMSLVYIDEGDALDENGEESRAERKRYYDTLVSRNVWRMMDEKPNTGPDPRFGLDTSVVSNDDIVDAESSASLKCINHFVAHEVWAVRCVGPVESWVVLRRWFL